jgi:predicted transcriptional regulator of viral defense system
MSQGTDLVRTIASEVGPLFTVDQVRPIARRLGLSDSQLRWTLSNLAKHGWLTRLKRGLYAVRPPLEGSSLHPFAVVAALVDPAAISHWSALAHHGMTTQIPPMVQASTTSKVVTPEMRRGEAHRPRGHAVWTVLDWEFEFITVRPQSWFGFQQEWVSQWHRVSITDPERTLLDMYAHPGAFGSIRAGMETLEQFIDHLDLERLVRYALRYEVGALIKRLGWTLERLDAPAAVLEPLRRYAVSDLYPLDPAGPETGVIVDGWHVRDNLSPIEDR